MAQVEICEVCDRSRTRFNPRPCLSGNCVYDDDCPHAKKKCEACERFYPAPGSNVCDQCSGVM